MKKNLLILMILSLLFIPSVYAESWDDYSDLDRAWDGQKTITNKEFEQVMDALQAKQKKKDARQRKKKIKKLSGGGNSLHHELNYDNDIPEMQLSKSDDEGLLINIPVDLYIEGKPFEKGYYNVYAEKSHEGKIYISLYQSHYLRGKIEAVETDLDFDEETVDFAKILPYDERFVKIIYGSVDFNAYAFVPYIDR